MRHLLLTLGLITSLSVLLPSCQSVPIGYLDTGQASYASPTIEVYRTLSEDDPHLGEGTPWSSMRIQGISGTNPIQYEYLGVSVSDGGDRNAFEQALKAGEITTQGGIINIFYTAVKKLPIGQYAISLRVSNEGHSRELKNIFTIIVRETQPALAEESISE